MVWFHREVSRSGVGGCRKNPVPSSVNKACPSPQHLSAHTTPKSLRMAEPPGKIRFHPPAYMLKGSCNSNTSNASTDMYVGNSVDSSCTNRAASTITPVLAEMSPARADRALSDTPQAESRSLEADIASADRFSAETRSIEADIASPDRSLAEPRSVVADIASTSKTPAMPKSFEADIASSGNPPAEPKSVGADLASAKEALTKPTTSRRLKAEIEAVSQALDAQSAIAAENDQREADPAVLSSHPLAGSGGFKDTLAAGGKHDI